MKELYNGRRVRRGEDGFPFRVRVRTFNEGRIGTLIVGIMGTLTFLLSVAYLLSSRVSGAPSSAGSQSCDTVELGYQCSPATSHLWGQYSPFFSLADELSVSSELPKDCKVTFVQVLSRHGARYPTSSKSKKYKQLVTAIQRNATSFKGKFAFLKTYNYTLGADDLTPFGEQQMVNSGIKFYQRYKALARSVVPFIRSSGSDRVIASGEKFIEGFQQAKLADSGATNRAAPSISVIIPESETFNNTLDHSVCTNFEASELGDEVEANFTALFAPAIRARAEKHLPGVKLTDDDVVSLMDMCSFDTVARTTDASQLSPFCGLFTHNEWKKYDYLQSLGKYYGYGAGNPLGPAQGIGFTNELIARLTHSPVQDHTSTNSTLDSNPATFPLNATMYVDFSHDNGMIPIFFAMGLYNGTKPLSQTSVESTKESVGYSASWAVPFGARAYFETMQCKSEKEPLVRALINDRVVPLHGCAVDKLGRCKLNDFVEGLSWARSGGNWGECFS
ncbi:histidine phosphatase family protein [Aspergillus novofumigatus IBT 16806]|uniref:Phytase A n=1 Tax=Aspergillus novofumigatus (strain IBT 16806) TaxID=1392255 RepID=A0A2I1C5P0_ASPN1|nr:phytase [Aspergillus novofumigatus IBT 16806]PKX92927.1 phytase [Aspergillus novofumigatus IBT 16806]